MNKETIVPKTDRSKIKIDIIGNYYITLAELAYLSLLFVIFVGSLIASIMYGATLGVAFWTIYAIVIVFTIFAFVPAGKNKVYGMFWKVIKQSTVSSVSQNRKDFDFNTDGFIKKEKGFIEILKVIPDSHDVADEAIIYQSFEALEKKMELCEDKKWYLVKHLETVPVDENLEYLDSLETDTKEKAFMVSNYKIMAEGAGEFITGVNYLFVESNSSKTLLSLRERITSNVSDIIKIEELSNEQKSNVLNNQLGLLHDKNKFQFKNSSFKNNKSYVKYLVVGSMNPELEWEWLADISSHSYVRYTIAAEKKDPTKAIKSINKQLNKVRSMLNNDKGVDYSKYGDMEEKVQSYQSTIDALRIGTQSIYRTNIVVEIWANSSKELNERTKAIKLSLRESGVRMITPFFDTRIVWDIINPLGKNLKRNEYIADMLSFTLAASWGFNSTSLTDKKGMLLGETAGGYSFWNPNMTNEELQNDVQKRKNLNITVMGGSGSGKSTLVQKFTNWKIVTGHPVWVIDPKDDDYFGLSKTFGGSSFEFGLSNGKNKINPFEVFGWETMSQQERKASLVSHGEFLDGWLNVLFEDKDFKNKIIQVFKEWSSGKEKLKAPKWLTFGEVEKIFKKKGSDYKSLVDKFSIFTTEDHFFNGQSTVEDIYKKDFVVFQVSQIFRSPSEELKNASLVLLTNLIQTRARSNKGSGKIFHAVIDEAHNFFNSTIGRTKMESLVREARGWDSGVVMISQQPQDFIEGGNIMNNITTAFYGSLDSQTTKTLSENLSLSKNGEGLNAIEKQFISGASRGEFLVVINSKEKLITNVVMSDNEFLAIKGGITFTDNPEGLVDEYYFTEQETKELNRKKIN